MAYDSSKGKFASLPLVNDLESQQQQRIIALLEKLDKVKDELKQFSKLQDEEDDILNELAKIQEETGRTGFRYGWLCFAVQKIPGRKILDPLLLAENGCPAAIIQQSYKQGNPSTRREFYRLKEEDLRT